MTHSAKIVADSMSPDGVRLTTMEVVFPRIVLAEFNTHRMLWGTEGSDYPEFSRNSASSRAIPVEKMIKMVQEHPFIPTHWGKNQKGMQAEQELSPEEQRKASGAWKDARSLAVGQARRLLDLGVHKQITNRLLEPFMWHTVIVTATEWDNYLHLRRHPAAHPEIRLAADKMYEAMAASEPKLLGYGDWHMPYIRDEDFEQLILRDPTHPLAVQQNLCKVSVGRCARVSLLTHDGRRDPSEDVRLHDTLLASGHMSPFEHVARPMAPDDRQNSMAVWNDTDEIDGYAPIAKTWSGNFRGWVQYRKLISNEHDILGAR
jgi:thymidylate synthase ThyX